MTRRTTLHGAAVATLAMLAGCNSAAVCSGDVGPETVTIDASGLLEDPGVSAVEVCLVIGEREAELGPLCSPAGAATVSYTTPEGDYPVTVDYYVTLRTGESSFVIPEEGGGTHHMECAATTTHISLPAG